MWDDSGQVKEPLMMHPDDEEKVLGNWELGDATWSSILGWTEVWHVDCGQPPGKTEVRLKLIYIRDGRSKQRRM